MEIQSCVRAAVIPDANAVHVNKRRKNMAYTPELSDEASCTLRRLAWSLNKPMTKAMEWIFTDLIKFIPSRAICEACKDPSKCSSCPFSNQGKPSGDLFAALQRKEKVNVEQADGSRITSITEVVCH